jgi:signal transduction histidine kinase
VKDLEGVLEEDIRSKQISVIMDTPLPRLTAERARIRQVFQNLIDNAIKYMGDGSAGTDGAEPVKEIHVGCVVRPDEAEFYVRDTGMGIDPEDVGKVFYVFRRGRNSFAHKVAGKGVGLASVKSIVETYSGTIWVDSRVGQGSTFRFTINGKFVARPGGAAQAVHPAQPAQTVTAA